jgi:hypothetical protein
VEWPKCFLERVRQSPVSAPPRGKRDGTREDGPLCHAPAGAWHSGSAQPPVDQAAALTPALYLKLSLPSY